jgi:transposase
MSRTVAYSLDLREAALRLIAEGKTQIETSRLLNVSRASIVRWLKRPSLAASRIGGSKPRELGIDLQELVSQNPGKTLAQLATLVPIQKTALSLRLRKANLTFKKNSILTPNPALKKKPYS